MFINSSEKNNSVTRS